MNLPRKVSALVFTAVFTIGALPVFGCWQVFDGHFEQVRADRLSLRVTDHGKPMKRAMIALHKALSRPAKWGYPDKWENEVLRKRYTDDLGRVSLGAIQPGKYWFIIAGDSYPIEVVSSKGSPSEKLHINFYADGCIEVQASGE